MGDRKSLIRGAAPLAAQPPPHHRPLKPGQAAAMEASDVAERLRCIEEFRIHRALAGVEQGVFYDPS